MKYKLNARINRKHKKSKKFIELKGDKISFIYNKRNIKLIIIIIFIYILYYSFYINPEDLYK